jgi:la-related protein 6
MDVDVQVIPATPTREEQPTGTMFNGLDADERVIMRENSCDVETPSKTTSSQLEVDDERTYTYSSREESESDDDEFHDTKETFDSEEEAIRGLNDESDQQRPAVTGPVDSELAEKIVDQVEFYFSDANITKDKFLLKHIWRNKQGFVSIKLITSFKRVKSLTRDWEVVSRVLSEFSKDLEVNEAGTKVRRRTPIPKPDKTSASRSVVLTKFSKDDPSVDYVKELMSQYGEIVLIRFFRPGTTLPQDIKEHQSAHAEFCISLCAVVEFKHIQEAERACSEMGKSENWRTGLRVKMLTKGDHKGSQKSLDGSPVEKRKKSPKKKSRRLDELIAEDGHSTCSSSEAEGLPIPQKNRKSSKSPRGTPENTSHLSISPTKSGNRSHSPSPEVYRRMSPQNSPRLARRKVSPSSTGMHHDHPSMSSRASPLLADRHAVDVPSSFRLVNKIATGSPDLRIIRKPTGPDGTQGFTKHRTHLS